MCSLMFSYVFHIYFQNIGLLWVFYMFSALGFIGSLCCVSMCSTVCFSFPHGVIFFLLLCSWLFLRCSISSSRWSTVFYGSLLLCLCDLDRCLYVFYGILQVCYMLYYGCSIGLSMFSIMFYLFPVSFCF